jgi:serine phosphatase RsbU (regulator of sigma subunit)/anti-sigma regulatory factor (Ser/Thr protein kinase)
VVRTTSGSTSADRLIDLQWLTAALGDTVSLDDVVRVTLQAALHLDGVVRVGIAVSRGAGRELSFVSSDEGAVSAAGVRWCTIDGYADVPLAQTVRDGDPVFLPSLADLQASYPHLVERQRSLGTRSLAALPLAIDGHRLGGLLLAYGGEREFDDDERAFLGAFTAQVTQALRRGIAFQAERSTSEQLQRSLMPHSLPDVDGLALGAHYQPGGLNVDVGGDWYDVVPLSDGSVVVSLGDVMGKGISAAIVMSELRAAMRAYALLDPTPGVVLDRLDNLVASLAVEEQIVTAVYGLVAPDRRSMTLSIAGHPPPLLVPASGRPQPVESDVGPTLGLRAGPWPETKVSLSDDVTVLFYSDGLVETRDIDFSRGLSHLCDRITELAPRRRNPRELCARLGELVWRLPVDDDVTILAAALTTSKRQLSGSTELPADASAAGRARRFVRRALADWDVDEEVADRAQLCASELVTNAVIHSGTPSKLTLRLDDACLLVMVQDEGNRGSVRQDDDVDPLRISGRGLALVDALSTAWSAEHSTDGTTVWCELGVSAAE